jgi:uncharacterized protein (DUF486 family)
VLSGKWRPLARPVKAPPSERSASGKGIALFEYLLWVPANRIGYATMTLGQLKFLQEIIALTVFVPFAMLYMKVPFELDYLWAALCLAGAAYFMFRV